MDVRAHKDGYVVAKKRGKRTTKPSPWQTFQEEEFRQAGKICATLIWQDRECCEHLAKGTSLTWRDVAMMFLLSTHGLVIHMPDGQVIGARRVNTNVQLILDQLSPDVGDVIVRLADGWAVLHVGNAGDVLTIDADTNLPGWEPGGSSGPEAFTDLTDVPPDYTGAGSKLVSVKADETGLEFTTPVEVPEAFTDLTDVPPDYTGQGGKIVNVKVDESGLEFSTVPPIPEDFTDLADVPGAYTGAGSKVVAVKADESGLEFVTPAGVEDFTDLSDVPGTYSGAADRLVAVKTDESGLDFIAADTIVGFDRNFDVPLASSFAAATTGTIVLTDTLRGLGISGQGASTSINAKLASVSAANHVWLYRVQRQMQTDFHAQVGLVLHDSASGKYMACHLNRGNAIVNAEAYYWSNSTTPSSQDGTLDTYYADACWFRLTWTNSTHSLKVEVSLDGVLWATIATTTNLPALTHYGPCGNKRGDGQSAVGSLSWLQLDP